MDLSVKSWETGADLGRMVKLPEEVFSIEPNDHAIYLDVKRHLAALRQGTHKTKERSELSGSTRKLFRQKGTGSARKGDINSPILRGGARVFGPRPRSYALKLNKAVKRLARCSALSYKVKEERVLVVDDFTFETPRTKDFVALCDRLGIKGRKVLFLLAEENREVYLSSRNVPGAEVLPIWQAYTYGIVNSDWVVVTERGIEWLNSGLADLDEVSDVEQVAEV